MYTITESFGEDVYDQACQAEKIAKWTRNIARSGGAVSTKQIMKSCPAIYTLYQQLLPICRQITGEPNLRLCPKFDQHSCAVYYYKRTNDGCKWHTDKCWYNGRRYTVLVGIKNTGVTDGHSSSVLEYTLHGRNYIDPILPGDIRLFDDRMPHMVHPLKEGEHRIVASFTYITDPTIRPLNRLIMEVKDNYGYFGIPASWILVICVLLGAVMTAFFIVVYN